MRNDESLTTNIGMAAGRLMRFYEILRYTLGSYELNTKDRPQVTERLLAALYMTEYPTGQYKVFIWIEFPANT